MKTHWSNVRTQLIEAGYTIRHNQDTKDRKKNLHMLVDKDGSVVFQSSYLGEMLCKASKEFGL